MDGWNHKLTLNDTWVDTFQSWATLGCLFVNANVEMPMFPTEYMLYCGDAEWTHKLFQKGYRIRFTPEIAVEHLEGAIIKAKYEPDELKQIWEADNRLFQERMK